MSYEINTKAEFEAFISHHWNAVNQHLDEEMDKIPTPIYSSVDIRESKDKFAPVDMNIYPAGFNNLCQLDLDASTKIFRQTINKHFEGAKKIVLIPESHTKNLFYLDHLAHLQITLRDAGFEVLLATFDENLFPSGNNVTLTSHSKFELNLFKAKLNGEGKITANDVVFDLAILNNDQSDPLPVDWDACQTPVIPTPKIGWFRRQKSEHFNFYKEVVKDFSTKYSINPQLIMADYRAIEGVDFSTKDGLEDIGKNIDEMLSQLAPGSKIFVKASQGTYGMGISVVSSGKEIVEMNRKNRDKMNIGKNKIKFTSVVLQEGVDSIMKYDNMAAEVAIYLVGGKPTGGFVRANSEKDNQANLNSKGMVFRRYCISEIRQDNDYQVKEAVYSVIARLSTIAGALEIQKINQEGA